MCHHGCIGNPIGKRVAGGIGVHQGPFAVAAAGHGCAVNYCQFGQAVLRGSERKAYTTLVKTLVVGEIGLLVIYIKPCK